jgi:hypothetical protein
MASINQVRGALLEEVVLKLLENAGYRRLTEADADGGELRMGRSGLELRGRGEWHQVDALVSYDFTPAFIYPIRLIVEAKAYLKNNGKVDIKDIRNAVGVLKDVNENYFSFNSSMQKNNELKYR